MPELSFPSLSLADWQPTRDTLHGYVRVLGAIRRALTPPQPHWSHISLRVIERGVTTTTIPAGSFTFNMLLDFVTHELIIQTSRSEEWRAELRGQSVAEFCADALSALSRLGVSPEIDYQRFNDRTLGSYDVAGVERYWQALSQIDAVLKRFKRELRVETSPVQLWPHHFDLALLWFSGRQVAGIDPNSDDADEQMNFGFSTGDEGIPDPYLYMTAYPMPEALRHLALPTDATWHTAAWEGACMMYEALVRAANPQEKLFEFLQVVHQAGARAFAHEEK